MSLGNKEHNDDEKPHEIHNISMIHRNQFCNHFLLVCKINTIKLKMSIPRLRQLIKIGGAVRNIGKGKSAGRYVETPRRVAKTTVLLSILKL